MTTTIIKSLKQKLIDELLKRSILHGDFTLSSGRKSTYYIDARRTTMSADGLGLIGELGVASIRAHGWKAAAVGGLTLGADPIAYAIALASRSQPPVMNAFTVRKEPKAHATGKQIEGCFEHGDAVVIVEDTFTTGASALRAAEVVRSAGGSVSGVLGLVDREEGGANAIRAAGYAVASILSIRDLGL